MMRSVVPVLKGFDFRWHLLKLGQFEVMLFDFLFSIDDGLFLLPFW